MQKFITVFHKSSDSTYLIEVARYARLYAARRWARNHPNAYVFVRVDVGADAAPLWYTFGDKYGPNTTWDKLDESRVGALPEILEEGRKPI